MHRLPRAFRLRQQQFVAPRVLNRLAQRRITTQSALKNSDGAPARVQAVRFKKPGLTLRRLATFGLYVGTTYAFLNIIFQYIEIEIEVLDDAEAEEEHEGAYDEDEEDSEYADEESLFIPLTWSKKMPRTFYRGSDPEWQEFVKVAKDKERHKKIQNELVQKIFSASQQRGIDRHIGKDAKIGKYWLDISFPDGPPPEFERSGIEIGDGFIAWSRQRIDAASQWRVTRALWPKAAFDSLWASTKVLAGINYRRAKQALGWEDKDPFSPEERYRHALEMMAKQEQAREAKGMGKAQLEPPGNSGALVGSSAAADTQASRSSPSDGKKLPWMLQVPMPPSSSTTNSTDIPIALHVFAHQLSRGWNPKQMEPPKGSFVVQGLVELRGSTGRVLFDVQSCYDPRESKFVMCKVGLRNFKRWNQAPRGGP